MTYNFEFFQHQPGQRKQRRVNGLPVLRVSPGLGLFIFCRRPVRHGTSHCNCRPGYDRTRHV
jgi:hypothetical protein